MANKLVEFQRLIENWDEKTIHNLVEFTRILNNSTKDDPKTPSILKVINNICQNFKNIYPLLRKFFHRQFTISQEELDSKLTIKKQNKKESFKCHLLLKALQTVIPSDIGIQKFVFKMERHDDFLHKMAEKFENEVKINIGEIASLKGKMEEETTKLKAEVESNKNAFDKVKQEVDDRAETNRRLEKEATRLNAENEFIKKELNEKVNTIRELREESENVSKAKTAEFKQIVEQITAKHDEEIKEKNDEIASLKKESENAFKTKTTEVKQNVEQIKTKPDDEKDDKVNAREKVHKAKNGMDVIDGLMEIVSELKPLDHKNASKFDTDDKNIVKTLKDKVERLTVKITEKNKIIISNKELIENHIKLAAERDKKIIRLNKEIERKKSEINNKTKNIERLAKEAVKGREQENAKLKYRMKVVKGNTKISDQGHTIKTLEKKINNKKSLISDLKQSVEDTKKILKEVTGKKEEEIEDKKGQICKLEECIKELGVESQKAIGMKDEIEQLKQQADELAALVIDKDQGVQEETQNLIKSLSDKNDEISRLNQTIGEVNAKISKLSDTIQKLKKNKKEERKQAFRLKKSVKRLQNNIKQVGTRRSRKMKKDANKLTVQREMIIEKSRKVVEMSNQIEKLKTENKELDASISYKNTEIRTLDLLLDKEKISKNKRKQTEEENLHLARTLSDKEDEVETLKETIRQNSKEHTKILKETIRQKSKEHRKIKRKLMTKYEKLKHDAIEDRRNIIQSYRQGFEQKDREMKNKYSPRLEKPSGFLTDIHGTNAEYAVKKPTETTKASQNKRKRGHNTHPFPSKTKKQKRDDESDNMLASVQFKRFN